MLTELPQGYHRRSLGPSLALTPTRRADGRLSPGHPADRGALLRGTGHVTGFQQEHSGIVQDLLRSVKGQKAGEGGMMVNQVSTGE